MISAEVDEEDAVVPLEMGEDEPVLGLGEAAPGTKHLEVTLLGRVNSLPVSG